MCIKVESGNCAGCMIFEYGKRLSKNVPVQEVVIYLADRYCTPGYSPDLKIEVNKNGEAIERKLEGEKI